MSHRCDLTSLAVTAWPEVMEIRIKTKPTLWLGPPQWDNSDRRQSFEISTAVDELNSLFWSIFGIFIQVKPYMTCIHTHLLLRENEDALLDPLATSVLTSKKNPNPRVSAAVFWHPVVFLTYTYVTCTHIYIYIYIWCIYHTRWTGTIPTCSIWCFIILSWYSSGTAWVDTLKLGRGLLRWANKTVFFSQSST